MYVPKVFQHIHVCQGSLPALLLGNGYGLVLQCRRHQFDCSFYRTFSGNLESGGLWGNLFKIPNVCAAPISVSQRATIFTIPVLYRSLMMLPPRFPIPQQAKLIFSLGDIAFNALRLSSIFFPIRQEGSAAAAESVITFFMKSRLESSSFFSFFLLILLFNYEIRKRKVYQYL